MKQVNIRLPEELIKDVKLYALENDKSIQDVVKEALEQLLHFIPKNKEEPRHGIENQTPTY